MHGMLYVPYLVFVDPGRLLLDLSAHNVLHELALRLAAGPSGTTTIAAALGLGAAV